MISYIKNIVVPFVVLYIPFAFTAGTIALSKGDRTALTVMWCLISGFSCLYTAITQHEKKELAAKMRGEKTIHTTYNNEIF